MTSTTQLTPLRYETPTVTLEVMAREAAISQWSDRPVVQILRFQLQVYPLAGEVPPVDICGDRDEFWALHQAVQAYLHDHLTENQEIPRDRAPHAPYLSAEGLTRHVLHLGSLKANEGEATTVMLGAIQLADLGDVLEQLDTQVRPLPMALTSSVRRRPWRQWGTIAASVIATVGLTTTLWPIYQSQQEVSETATEAPLADQQVVTAPPSPERLESASPPETVELPEDEPAETAATTDNTDASEANREPAEVGPQVLPEATPKANLPNSASLPSSEAAEPKPASEPASSEPAQANDSQLGPPSPEAAPIPQSPAPSAPTAGPEIVADSEVGDLPADDGLETSSGENVAATSPAEADTPSQAAIAAGSSAASISQRGAERASEPTPNDSLDSFEDDTSESFALPAERTASPSLEAAPAPTLEASATAPNLATLNAEITEQWDPPANLDRTLTYTLTLKADGTLAAILPADDLADRYRDRAGLPSVGAQIVLPGGAQRIQVFLSPDGTVQVFPIAPE